MAVDLRPPRFEPELEAAYRSSRTPWTLAMAHVGAGLGLVMFLGMSVFDVIEGTLAATWPVRYGTAAGFLLLLLLVRRGRWSLLAIHIILAAGFGLATLGFGLIVVVNDVVTFDAGVAGFIVAMSIVAVAPVTHRALLGVLIVSLGNPVVVYWLAGADNAQMTNVVSNVVIAGAFVYLAWRVTDLLRRRAFLAERALEAERRKVADLIRKMVPGSIADRLESGQLTISDRHEAVTVLFADIVGFTRFSESHDPEDVVGLLNDLFSEFDSLVVEHGAEKIKTIGDGYMAAAGAPQARVDHAAIVVGVARAMQQALEDFGLRHGVHWQLRIGIHTGPVVAGVIGTDRYAYDLWGDTVNVASRLESTGTAGEIHMSADTVAHLDGDFELSPLGPVQLKNRGPVEAYRLVG